MEELLINKDLNGVIVTFNEKQITDALNLGYVVTEKLAKRTRGRPILLKSLKTIKDALSTGKGTYIYVFPSDKTKKLKDKTNKIKKTNVTNQRNIVDIVEPQIEEPQIEEPQIEELQREIEIPKQNDQTFGHVKDNKFSFSFKTGKGTETIQIPKPLIFKDMTPEQEWRYINFYKEVFSFGNNKTFLNWQNCRILEMVAVRSDLCFSPLDLTINLPFLFAEWWFQDINSHLQFLFIEDIEDSSFYIHDPEKEEAPFCKVTEKDVLSCISSWIFRLFRGNPPQIVGELEFAKRVLNHILLKVSTNSARLYAELPPGLPFKSGFVGLPKNESELGLIPYSKKTFFTNVIPTDVPISFLSHNSQEKFLEIKESRKLLTSKENHSWENKRNNQPDDLDTLQAMKEAISEPAFQFFLKVITEEDHLKVMSLRSLLQRIIFAKEEGRNYQQCFWLWGAPGSSKSTWAEICKMIAWGSVVELSKTQNQFTSQSLKGKKLLLISDVSRITTDMTEALRVILGRDRLYYEEKNKNIFEYVEPYCQVLIITNPPPDRFPLLWERPEIRDKITPLEFKQTIPQELMIADLKEHLYQFAPQFLSWAIYIPRKWLLQQTRSRLLNEYQELTGSMRKTEYHYFIEEMLCVPANPSVEAKITKADLRNAYEKWAVQNNTLEEVVDKNTFLRYLPGNIFRILNNEYQVKVEEKRLGTSANRVWGFTGVTLRGETNDTSRLLPIRFPKSDSFEFLGYDPYEDLVPYENSVMKKDDFAETQRKILELRRNK